MSIDDSARWLSRVTLAVAIIMIGWGLSVVLGQPVTAWFAATATFGHLSDVNDRLKLRENQRFEIAMTV